jgi:hypothetical protein
MMATVLRRSRVLYVRDEGGVVERVAEIAAQVRRAHPGARVSDADVARQLLMAASETPSILRRLGVNGRGARASDTLADR